MQQFSLERCVWEITLACCFSCKYCGSAGGKARENELSTEECLHVADELGALGCQQLSLIGGEVFLRPDWKAILQRVNENNISVNIITNGFLFREELIRDLKQLQVSSVSVSLDSVREIHDKYRQEGSYDRALQAIADLCAAGIPVSVISTLNSENVRHLEELYGVLCSYPIFAWQLQACIPMGHAAKNLVNYAFDPALPIAFVNAHLSDAPFLIGLADSIGYFTPEEAYLRGDREGGAYFRGCGAGISSIGIDSIGNVRGCESLYDEHFVEGNLRQRSLREIWEDPEAFAYNRKFDISMLEGGCKGCEFGFLCAGGCRSYNYFAGNSLYEAPRCAGRENGFAEMELTE